jgi:hypothetical protein
MNDYDGKYLVQIYNDEIQILKNGDLWKCFDIKGKNKVVDIILMLVQEIIDLQEIIEGMNLWKN